MRIETGDVLIAMGERQRLAQMEQHAKTRKLEADTTRP
jgi:hypothetical protein